MTTDLKVFNSIIHYLKKAISPWRTKITKQYDGKCCFTQQYRSVGVHHVSKSFDAIVRETFAVTNIKFRKCTYEYTEAELYQLSTTCLSLHRDVAGVVVTNWIHQEYHKIYGISSASCWQEFKKSHKKKKVA